MNKGGKKGEILGFSEKEFNGGFIFDMLWCLVMLWECWWGSLKGRKQVTLPFGF